MRKMYNHSGSKTAIIIFSYWSASIIILVNTENSQTNVPNSSPLENSRLLDVASILPNGKYSYSWKFFKRIVFVVDKV